MRHLPERVFRLDLYRHGESDANAEGKRIGIPDSPLTVLGHEQKKTLGSFLKRISYVPTEVYASPYPRALQTSQGVCEEIGFPLERIVQDKRLAEIDRGDWDGLEHAKVITPDVRRRALWEDMDFATPNGQSMHVKGAEMYRWVLDTCFEREIEPSSTIAVFSHGLAIKCLLHRILELPANLTWRLQLANTSITSLSYDASGWKLDRINALPHLPEVGFSMAGA